MNCLYCGTEYEIPSGSIGLIERTWADRVWDQVNCPAPSRVLVHQAAGTTTIPYHLADIEGTIVLHECRDGHASN